jgi:nicotinamidase-related amidase
MKRRTFVQGSVLAGMTDVILSRGPSGHALNSGIPLTGADDCRDESPKILSLKGEYYRHHPVDFSKGPLGALGMKGWAETVTIEAPLKETALVSMHAENIGLVPQIPYADKGPLAGYMRWLEYEGRKMDILRDIYPRILAAARGAGLPVVHVSMEDYGKKYPGYKKALQLSGPDPQLATPKAPGAGKLRPPDDIKGKLVFGERYNDNRDEEHFGRFFDFAEPAKPRDDEFVVETSHQLSSVLNAMGAWNLIYIGFAVNWCLWFSGGGMVDMSRLGYRCSCIREAVTAVENKESVRGEQHKEEALWRTSLMFGYVFTAEDFISACERI